MGRSRYLVAAAFWGIVIAACGTPYTEALGPAAGNDAGAEGDSPSTNVDSGLVSLPGFVDCNAGGLCSIASGEYCCIKSAGDGGADFSCVIGDVGCSENRSKCDEAADCAPGQSCCATLSFGSFATICDTACSIAQSCRTDAECGSQKCIKQSCTGLTGWLCGKNPFCSPL